MRRASAIILTTIFSVCLWVQPSWARPDAEVLWHSSHDAGLNDSGWAAAVSPDGTRVFLTGESDGAENGYDYNTIAYDATTGREIWTARYNGPGDSYDWGKSVAVSPDGTKVFVTGESLGPDSYNDYATVAYDAATGAELWVQRYAGPANGYDNAYSVAAGPDGRAVYVTGNSQACVEGCGNQYDYLTVAYDAATGAQMWVARYEGPAKKFDSAYSVAATPDGSSVLVTGTSWAVGDSQNDYATIAYDAVSGATQWIARYDEGVGDIGQDVKVSPDSSTAFVTGYNGDYVTIAYDVATGTPVWTSSFDGSHGDQAYALSVSPNGKAVVVTGRIIHSQGYYDFATVAYNAATGAQRWVRRLGSPLNDDVPVAVAVSPDNRAVFVTGDDGWDFVTVAYRLSTGHRLWADRVEGPGRDYAYDLAVNPDGTAVYVTGSSWDGDSYNTLTVAYAAS